MTGDRLMRLGMARRALRWARVESPEAFRRATSEQLADLGDHVPRLRRLIGRARPDVLATLFDPPDWYVAGLPTGPADRLLCIDGRESIPYRAGDLEDERRAWAMIVAAGRRPTSASTHQVDRRRSTD